MLKTLKLFHYLLPWMLLSSLISLDNQGPGEAGGQGGVGGGGAVCGLDPEGGGGQGGEEDGGHCA